MDNKRVNCVSCVRKAVQAISMPDCPSNNCRENTYDTERLERNKRKGTARDGNQGEGVYQTTYIYAKVTVRPSMVIVIPRLSFSFHLNTTATSPSYFHTNTAIHPIETQLRFVIKTPNQAQLQQRTHSNTSGPKALVQTRNLQFRLEQYPVNGNWQIHPKLRGIFEPYRPTSVAKKGNPIDPRPARSRNEAPNSQVRGVVQIGGPGI
jgi:hypothetical protein